MKVKYPFLDLAQVNAPYMDEMIRAAERVIRSGRYVGGDENNKFERLLTEMTGAPCAIGVSNGLDALRLILRGYIEMGVMSAGDEIIVPGNTYVASVLAISDAGLRPVLVDPGLYTMNLDSSLIEEKITPRTKGIMTVHLYGRVAWDEELVRLADKYDLRIIEDNAQGIGGLAVCEGRFSSRRTGGLGDAAAFSFYPTKNIGAVGDAGAVTTHDEDLARTVRALANYGSDRRYHNIYRGFNCRLDPIQAAMLCVKLPHTDSENADRFERALTYSRNISHPLVITPLISSSVTDNVWHQYVIRIKGGRRDDFIKALAEKGVATDIHYAVPPHRQPCYADLELTSLPVTDLLAEQVVSLPIATGTSVKDVAEISEIINEIRL